MESAGDISADSRLHADKDNQERNSISHILKLYVTGATSRSVRAIANIRRICEEYLKDRYELEVVDIYRDPVAAKEHQIVAVPTLVKLQPEPLRKIVGDLSNAERLIAGLDLDMRSASK